MESFTTSTSDSKCSEAKLPPLSGLVDADEVYKVYYDVFRGYRRLYDQGGAEHLHCNINYADIVCRRHDDGSVSGVLLDLDVSSSSSSAQRTPAPNVFKAIDLLCADPPKPLYRHDLESLFYVMVWHTHRYQDGKLVDDPPFEDWARGNFSVVRNSKTSFILSGNIDPTPQHKPLRALLSMLKHALSSGYSACQRTIADDGTDVSPTPEEQETLCGHFSFEIWEKLFGKYDPRMFPAPPAS